MQQYNKEKAEEFRQLVEKNENTFDTIAGKRADEVFGLQGTYNKFKEYSKLIHVNNILNHMCQEKDSINPELDRESAYIMGQLIAYGVIAGDKLKDSNIMNFTNINEFLKKYENTNKFRDTIRQDVTNISGLDEILNDKNFIDTMSITLPSYKEAIKSPYFKAGYESLFLL